MPRRDGTGPVGNGPMTGWGMGPCEDRAVRYGAGFGPGPGRGLACRRGFGRGLGMGNAPTGGRRAQVMRERAAARTNFGK